MAFNGTDLNVVDLLALILIFLSAIAGIRNGFINGFLELLGLFASIYLAFKGYGPIAERLIAVAPLPKAIVNLGAFIAVFVLCQILFVLIFRLVARATRQILRFFLLFRLANAAAGVLPGVVKGIIIVTLLMLPFGLFPIIPGAKSLIENSYVGSRLISAASDIAPRLEAILGQSADETLTFLSRSQPGNPLNLGFASSSALAVNTDAENRMLEMVNAERAKSGLQSLIMDKTLQGVARDHSREMFELSYFAHESPVNGTPGDRIRASGAKFTMAAENLAYAPNVEMAHSGLMNSPGHRENILTPGFRRIGIGVINGGINGEMFTQNFTD